MYKLLVHFNLGKLPNGIVTQVQFRVTFTDPKTQHTELHVCVFCLHDCGHIFLQITCTTVLTNYFCFTVENVLNNFFLKYQKSS